MVKDVTFRAFRALVDYIYGKPLDRVFFEVLGLEAVVRMLELAYAAEKYQVKIPREISSTNFSEISGTSKRVF